MDSPTSSTFKLTLNEDNVNLDNSYHTNQQKKLLRLKKKERKREFIVTEQIIYVSPFSHLNMTVTS